MAIPKQEVKSERTQILNLLRAYNGESYVYNHFTSPEKRQGYHLNEKSGLTNSDLRDGVRIPIKDVGALVIRLSSSEDRLEISFNARANYFWVKNNLEEITDGSYIASANGVYDIAHNGVAHQAAHISITDTEK